MLAYVRERSQSPFEHSTRIAMHRYAERRTIDLDAMEPLVALPGKSSAIRSA